MAKKLLSDKERLMKSVEVVTDSCWIWTGPLERDGYARQMKVGSRTDNTRKMVRPHRFSYTQFVGPIPDGYTIDHLCRIRCCVNPEHLEPVSAAENTQRGYRATKMYCRHGHPLFGDNMGLVTKTGFRFCRTCHRQAIRTNYRKTDGAAQKKYAENNREKRRLAQAKRRASWSSERLELERARQRAYDLQRRPRKTSNVGGENRSG